MSSPLWPDAYRTWRGSLPELVATAATVLNTLNPAAKAPSERTARLYKTRGLLQAEGRQGHADVYGFEALAALVSAKDLVKQGWTLDNASQLLNSHPDASAYVSAAPAPEGRPSAVEVVSRLLQQAPAPEPSPAPLVNWLQLGGAQAPGPLPASTVTTTTTAVVGDPLAHLNASAIAAQAASAPAWLGTAAGGLSAASGGLAGAGVSPSVMRSTGLGGSLATPAEPAWATQPLTDWLRLQHRPDALAQASREDRHAAARQLETFARQLRRGR